MVLAIRLSIQWLHLFGGHFTRSNSAAMFSYVPVWLPLLSLSLQVGVPPVKWSINWDSIIPLFGGFEKDRTRRKTRPSLFDWGNCAA